MKEIPTLTQALNWVLIRTNALYSIRATPDVPLEISKIAGEALTIGEVVPHSIADLIERAEEKQGQNKDEAKRLLTQLLWDAQAIKLNQEHDQPAADAAWQNLKDQHQQLWKLLDLGE